jgi:hypothetical protein
VYKYIVTTSLIVFVNDISKSGSSGMSTRLTVDCLMSSTKYFMHIQMSINSIIFKNYIKMNISSAGVWKLLCNLNPHTSCRPDNSTIIKRTSCLNININIFDITGYNILHNFTTESCKRYRTVIYCFIFFTFFKCWRYACVFPVFVYFFLF